MIDGVHIWRAALDDPGWPGPGALPAAERERAADILRERDRRHWVASRWALRRVLARYLEVAANTVELEIDRHGKPRLREESGPEFNLSHSHGLALVALADRPVGVDLEAIRPRRNLVAIAERALGPDDAAAVGAADPARRAEVFYAAWARQEARLKCLGTGFGASPDQTPVAVAEVAVAPGYAAAVALAGRELGPLSCLTLHAG